MILTGKPHLLETAHQYIRVKHPHDHLLPECRGQCGKAKLHLVPVRAFGFQTTILGFAFFRHIQAAENLQTAGHRRHDGRRQFVNIVQHPINAETHLAGFPSRLQMDVAGALGKSVLQDPVHNIDDVLIVRIVVPLPHFQQLLEVGNPGHLLTSIARGSGDRAAEIVELDAVTAKLLRVGQHHLQLTVTQHLLQMPLPVLQERLITGHHYLVTLHLHRDNAVPLGKGIAHHVGHLVHMHLQGVNVVHLHAGALAQPVGEKIHIQQLVGIAAIGQPVLGQHLDRVPVQLLLLPRRGGDNIEVLLAHTPFIQQLAHQPTHINQQSIRYRRFGSGVHKYSPSLYRAGLTKPHPLSLLGKLWVL